MTYRHSLSKNNSHQFLKNLTTVSKCIT